MAGTGAAASADHLVHPEAIDHLPFFITPPGQTDVLFVVMVVIVVIIVVLIGGLYLTLHSIPERMAHEGNKTQLQIVAVLTLIGLFTHNNALWLGALLLALVRIPDFRTPLVVVADSLDRIARRLERRPPPDADAPTDEPPGREIDAPHGPAHKPPPRQPIAHKELEEATHQ